MAEAPRPVTMFAIHTSPLAVRREVAAAMLSISPSEFDLWVKRGTMPRPKKVGKMSLWDMKKIEAAYELLMDGLSAEGDQWDQVAR